MNVSCIILNYNDAETTERLVSAIGEYKELNSVVVVDNCSADGSAERLDALAGGRIHVLHAEKNGGYGSGNNMGIRYAMRELGATHVVIANPDVVFTERCLRTMKRAFLKVERCGIVSAVVRDPDGGVQLSGWRLNGLLGDLLDTGLITRRVFKRFLNDRPELRKDHKSWCFVDAVPGSFFMADAQALKACGFYDEDVFLYYEEKILGFKMKRLGYRTVLLLNHSYIHMHSVSIDKNVKSILKKQALLHESKLYYYKKYLKISRFTELPVRLALRFLMAEIWFLTEVLGMSW